MTTFRAAPRRVEFCDTDMAGIVHFSNFFRYMEAAECELLRSLGLMVKIEWEGLTLGFPRVSATCDYMSPARFEDVLDIDVSVERLGEKSITFGFAFSKNGAAVARGKVTSVCCRVWSEDRFEPIRIPESYRARFAPYVSV